MGKFRIVLIRHGKTAENIRGAYLGGKTDVILSDLGKSQLLEVREELTKNICAKKEARIFSSPMKRCIETARLLFDTDSIYVFEGFREIDFGDFEGQSYESLKDNPDYQSWIDSGGVIAFPNGESREDFIDRTMESFCQLIKVLRDEERTEAALICHGGSIMAIMSQLCLGDYFDFQVKNLGGYILEFTINEKDEINDISYTGICHRLSN